MKIKVGQGFLTTATEEEIIAHLEVPPSEIGFDNRGYVFCGGDKLYAFDVYTNIPHWRTTIEEAIKNAGHKFRWL